MNFLFSAISLKYYVFGIIWLWVLFFKFKSFPLYKENNWFKSVSITDLNKFL